MGAIRLASVKNCSESVSNASPNEGKRKIFLLDAFRLHADGVSQKLWTSINFDAPRTT